MPYGSCRWKEESPESARRERAASDPFPPPPPLNDFPRKHDGMVRSVVTRRTRKEEVRRRAAAPNHMFKDCRVIGCRRPARAATGDGLDTRWCRVHADQYARHGSPYRKSFTARELNPYRRAAVTWLIVSEGDRYVANAIKRVEGLYGRAGSHEEAFRLRGMSPKERARKAWARLRHHKVDPRVVIAAWLAVEMATTDLPGADDRREYKQVQAAKIIHRLASGTHKRWSAGPAGPAELHAYPVSRGLVLRYIGASLESAAELLAPRAVEGALVLKRASEGAKGSLRPHPRSLKTRPRPK